MKISIEYCMQWNYEPTAFSLRDELMDKFLGESDSFEVELIESGGGVFEVTVNDSLIFSKKELDRFPNENEISEIVERFGLI